MPCTKPSSQGVASSISSTSARSSRAARRARRSAGAPSVRGRGGAPGSGWRRGGGRGGVIRSHGVEQHQRSQAARGAWPITTELVLRQSRPKHSAATEIPSLYPMSPPLVDEDRLHCCPVRERRDPDERFSPATKR